MEIQALNSEKKELLGKILFGISILFLIYMIFTPLNQYFIHTDEYFTAALIRQSLGDIINLTAADVHPPLYYLLVKVLLKGLSLLNIKYNLTVVLKLISVIPYFFILLISWFKLRKEYGWFVIGLFCFVLALISEFFIYFILARMYSWGLLFLFLGFLCFRDILNKSDIKSWVLFTLFAVLAAYTHYFVALSFGILYLLLFVYYVGIYGVKNNKFSIGSLSFNEKLSLNEFRFKNEFLKLVSSMVLSIVLYIPWINVLLNQISYVKNYFWVEPIGINDVFSFLVYFSYPNFSLLKLNLFAILSLISMVFFIYLLISYLRHSKEDSPKERYFILSGFLLYFLTIFLGTFLSVIYKPILIQRYLIPSSAIIWFTLIVLIDKLRNRKLLFVSLVLILILSVNGISLIAETTNDLYSKGYDDAKFLSEINNGKNIVIIDPCTLLIYGPYLNETSQYCCGVNDIGIDMNHLKRLNDFNVVSLNETKVIIEKNKDKKDIYIFKYIDSKEIMKDNGKTYFPLKDGDNIEYIEVKPKHSISKNRYFRFYKVL